MVHFRLYYLNECYKSNITIFVKFVNMNLIVSAPQTNHTPTNVLEVK